MSALRLRSPSQGPQCWSLDRGDGETRHDTARLIDFNNPSRNDYVVVNQMSVEQHNRTRRPNVLVFVNGIPLGILELKVPGQQAATLRGAWGAPG